MRLFSWFLLFCAPLAQAKTLNMLVSDAPATLDWNGLTTMTESPILAQICEGLFTYEYPSRKLVPAIAESVSKSKDLREYTFTIRKDAKWSDGRAVYAQDFVDSWLRLISPQSSSLYSFYLFDVENAREYHGKTASAEKVGIRTAGDRTLIVRLKKPMANWEANLTFWPLYPIRKDLIEKFGENWWRAGVLLSTGPFMLDSYEQGKKMILKRNPHHPTEGSNVDEVVINFQDNPKKALALYDEGKIDFLDFLPREDIKKISARKDFRTSPILKHYVLIMNARKFPMSDPKFRSAIFKAINPKELISPPIYPYGPTLIPPPVNGSQKPPPSEFNVENARADFAKSGVVASKKLKVRLLTVLSEPFLGMAKIIQSQLSKNLKIEVELAAYHNKEHNAYIALNDFDILTNSWTGKVPVPQDFLLPYSSFASNSRLKYTNASFDEAIEKAVASIDPKEQASYLFEAQNLYQTREHVLFPLVFESIGYLKPDRIENLYYNHMGIPIVSKVVIH